MTTDENQKLQAEEVKTSKPLFDTAINYEEPAEDRPYVFKVENTLLYVNKEQYAFLNEDRWNEYHENWERSRCLVPSQRGELKVCRNKCEECPLFRYGNKKPTYVLFSDWDEEEYVVQNHQESPLDLLIKEEEQRMMYEAIASLTNPIDKQIIDAFLNEISDSKIAEVLGISRTSVIYKRQRCIEKIKKFLNL